MKTTKRLWNAGLMPFLLIAVCAWSSVKAAVWSFAEHSAIGSRAVLGDSYNKINALSRADMTAEDAAIQEELWVRDIIFGADTLYQDNPFADGMTGAPGSGRPITQIIDPEKVHGQIIHVPLMSGFGGPGVAGEGDRTGNEQKIDIGTFPIKIGRLWFGYAFKSTARDETVVGGKLDPAITTASKEQLAKKRNDDHIMRMIQATGTTKGARNLIYPDGYEGRDTLDGAGTFSTDFWISGCDELPGVGAVPMNISKDPGGSKIERYMAYGTNRALRPLSKEATYTDALTRGDVRGNQNAVFTGEYREWLGQGLYRWYMRDHANNGPIGSPLEPRARLGVALTGATTNTVVNGGGYRYKSGEVPSPQYFEFFSNAPYTFFNGDTIAADVATQRYLQIINPTGTYGTFPYILNSGNQITLSGAAMAVGDSAKRTTNFVQGALIVECNVLGQSFGRVLFLGGDALVSGYGSIDGKKVNPKMGRRTEEIRNHELDIAMGVESVWGNAAVTRTDGLYPNFLVGEVAIPVPGAPLIAS